MHILRVSRIVVVIRKQKENYCVSKYVSKITFFVFFNASLACICCIYVSCDTAQGQQIVGFTNAISRLKINVTDTVLNWCKPSTVLKLCSITIVLLLILFDCIDLENS